MSEEINEKVEPPPDLETVMHLIWDRLERLEADRRWLKRVTAVGFVGFFLTTSMFGAALFARTRPTEQGTPLVMTDAASKGLIDTAAVAGTFDPESDQVPPSFVGDQSGDSDKAERRSPAKPRNSRRGRVAERTPARALFIKIKPSQRCLPGTLGCPGNYSSRASDATGG